MKQAFIKILVCLLVVTMILPLASCAGKQGPQGEQGIAGEKGEKGDKGDKGDKGEKGDSGTMTSVLKDKKIVYDGDSICEERYEGQAANGGAYAKIIADLTGGTYENQAVGGGTLASQVNRPDTSWGGKNHSVVDNLDNLPIDGDLYCFEGGINDYWQNIELGDFDPDDYDSELDIDTVCGALEYIFRYAIEVFEGKPICFVITHKISEYNTSTGVRTGYTFTRKNSATIPYTFAECYEKLVGICEKYAIPYYDAYNESGLNSWNEIHNNTYLTAGGNCTPTQGDGCHPNEEAYKRYYVPQLIALFEKIMPV